MPAAALVVNACTPRFFPYLLLFAARGFALAVSHVMREKHLFFSNLIHHLGLKYTINRPTALRLKIKMAKRDRQLRPVSCFKKEPVVKCLQPPQQAYLITSVTQQLQYVVIRLIYQ